MGISLVSLKSKSCGCLKKETGEKRRSNLTGKKFGRWIVQEYSFTKTGRAYWKCLCKCGKIKYVSSTGLLTGDSKSCGCLHKEHASKAALSRKRPCGMKHHRWRHDLSQKDRELNKCRNYLPQSIVWRKRVFERDNYTCQLSGRRGNVNAHHISAWSKNKRLRFVVSNGITLKQNIHKLFHGLYGRGYNTPKQFREFSERYRLGEFDLTLNAKLNNIQKCHT
jgi:hypothetical protein